jgi:hypothetical protein
LLSTVVLVLLAFGVLGNSLGAGVNPLRAAIGFTGRVASVPARGQYRKTVPYRPKKLPIPVPSREECPAPARRQRQVISCRHQALTCARGGRVVGFCAHQTMQVSEKKRAPAPGSPPPPVDPCCSAEVASRCKWISWPAALTFPGVRTVRTSTISSRLYYSTFL